jgi:hypothetical protein
VKIDLYEVLPAGAAGAAAATSDAAGAATSDAWWTRRRLRELLPAVERGNAAVKHALKELHWEAAGGGGRWGRRSA